MRTVEELVKEGWNEGDAKILLEAVEIVAKSPKRDEVVELLKGFENHTEGEANG